MALAAAQPCAICPMSSGPSGIALAAEFGLGAGNGPAPVAAAVAVVRAAAAVGGGRRFDGPDPRSRGERFKDWLLYGSWWRHWTLKKAIGRPGYRRGRVLPALCRRLLHHLQHDADPDRDGPDRQLAVLDRLLQQRQAARHLRPHRQRADHRPAATDPQSDTDRDDAGHYRGGRPPVLHRRRRLPDRACCARRIRMSSATATCRVARPSPCSTPRTTTAASTPART